MSDAPALERIGKYPVIKLLGRGATSEVFLCNDPFNGRDVAVKVVSTDLFEDPSSGKLFKKLFVNEASLAGKLQHPHIVQIYDAVAEEICSEQTVDASGTTGTRSAQIHGEE